MKYLTITLVAVTLLSSEISSLSIEKVDKVEKESNQEVETSDTNTQWKRKLMK